MRATQSSSQVASYPLYADVVIEGGLDTPLEYGVKECDVKTIQEGMRVSIPVRGSNRLGIVLKLKKSPSYPKVLPIQGIKSEDWDPS